MRNNIKKDQITVLPENSPFRTLYLGVWGLFTGQKISPQETAQVCQESKHTHLLAQQQFNSFENTINSAEAALERSRQFACK